MNGSKGEIGAARCLCSHAHRCLRVRPRAHAPYLHRHPPSRPLPPTLARSLPCPRPPFSRCRCRRGAARGPGRAPPPPAAA